MLYEYEVEVQRTISIAVKVVAKNPRSAAKTVDKTSFPLPPANEWDTLEGWTYIVRDPQTSEELYEGDGQGPE